MTDDGTTDRRGGPLASVRSILGTVVRVALDGAVLALWVVFLTLLFLETNWPRWAFYGLLLLGVGVYVSVTAPWVDGDSPPAE